MNCKARQELCRTMDSYNMTLAHTPRAGKPFRLRTYEKRLCKPFGIRTCKIIRLKTAWNQHLQEYGGFPPVRRFRTASEKTAGGTRALRSFPLTFWRDACTISASSPKSLIAVVRAAGDRRRGTHHGHRDDYGSSLPQLH